MWKTGFCCARCRILPCIPAFIGQFAQSKPVTARSICGFRDTKTWESHRAKWGVWVRFPFGGRAGGSDLPHPPQIIQNFSFPTGTAKRGGLWERGSSLGFRRIRTGFPHPFENPCGKVRFVVIHTGKSKGSRGHPVVFRRPSTYNPQRSHTPLCSFHKLLKTHVEKWRGLTQGAKPFWKRVWKGGRGVPFTHPPLQGTLVFSTGVGGHCVGRVVLYWRTAYGRVIFRKVSGDCLAQAALRG